MLIDNTMPKFDSIRVVYNADAVGCISPLN